jgi:hypothetical protein
LQVSKKFSAKQIKYFKFFILYSCLFFYQSLTLVNLYLPPFLGFVAVSMLIHKYKKEKDIEVKDGFNWYFSVFFLILIEQIHNFYLFSSAIIFILSNYILRDLFLRQVKSRFLLIVLFVSSQYFGTFLLSNFFFGFNNKDFLNFGFLYIYYIFLESVLATLFLERVK